MKQECTSLVYGKGKTTLPKIIRNQLNIEDGSVIVYTINSNGITISSENILANYLKKMVTSVTKGKSLVEELIHDRKLASKHE